MKELQSDETLLKGSWLKEREHIVGDEVCRRIELLIKQSLEFLIADSSGWDKLYRDRNDGRLWELTYPQGEMHGGGPPQLRVVSPKNLIKYRLNVDQSSENKS